MSCLFCCWSSGRKDREEGGLSLPRIVITFADDTGGLKEEGKPITNISGNETLDEIKRKTREKDESNGKCVEKDELKGKSGEKFGERDELSRAHQEVINQMRIAIKEARGGGSNQTEASDKTEVSSRPGSTGEIKPPVPTSKAAAVAKIRAAIAQSKSTSSDVNCDKAVDKARLNDEKKKSEIETSSDENIKPNPARDAAVGKLKAAILAAALSKLDSEESQRTSAKRTESLNARNKSQKSQNGTDNSRERRRSAGDESSGRNKQKAVIWDFFEEGKKKCTCRTCGYIVNTKMNTGGLVRHLSLVHQREYREYTIRMDKNWTHGMMEKNLNMKLPKNF